MDPKDVDLIKRLGGWNLIQAYVTGLKLVPSPRFSLHQDREIIVVAELIAPVMSKLGSRATLCALISIW